MALVVAGKFTDLYFFGGHNQVDDFIQYFFFFG